MNDIKPTSREVNSFIEAYRQAPWGTLDEYDDVRKYIAKFYLLPDGFAKAYRQSLGQHPFMYIHGTDYKHNIHQLIDQELAGDHAYWRATNREQIEGALDNAGNVFYISNIHADKSVHLSAENKPRLKLLPGLVGEIFKKYDTTSVVLYTHRSTAVFDAVCALDSQLYHVRKIDYYAQSPESKHNSNCSIDYLMLLIITKIFQ